MLGNVVPPGPFGRLLVPLWHDRHVPVPVATTVGFASVWHTEHSGEATFGEVPV
jgi:hypothetical protein